LKSDDQLVSIIQREDRGSTQVGSAWEDLVAKYNPILLNDSLRFWHSDHTEAEQSVQNTWMKLISGGRGGGAGKGIDLYRLGTEGDGGNFSGWIRTVAQRQCIDDYRKKRRVNVGEYIANPDYDPYTEEGRQERKFIDRNASLDAPDSWNMEGDDGQPGAIEREVNKRQAEVKWLSGIVPSAEDALIDNIEEIETRYRNLIGKFLSNNEATFFLDYQEDDNPKSNADKKRFFDYKAKQWRNMIADWLGQGRQLEDIMNQRQVNVLTRRFSQRQNKSQIFKEMGLTGMAELEELLASSSGLLLRALLDETPDV